MTTTEAQGSARALINGFLSQYGLGSLAEWAWQRYLNGDPVEQIMIELRSTPEYQQRFPAMQRLAQRGRAISEAAYVEYEKQATAIFRAAGLPESFYNQPGDFGDLIGGEVSLNELNQRVNNAYLKVLQAPPQVRDTFARYYGPGSDAALAAYILDDQRALPDIEQKVIAARFGGRAEQLGFNIQQPFAESLAEQGIADEQLQRGLDQAAELRGLTRSTLGEAMSGTNVSTEDLLSASVGATDPGRVKRAVEDRAAVFSGSGGAQGTSGGVSGLGTSQRG